MGISAAGTGVGGWTVGPLVGRRPAGAARDVVHPGTGARAVMVIVDGRFTGRGLPDPETVARAAIVGSPAVMPMLDAGLLEDGTRWYVTPAAPGPVLDPAAGCSPRRAVTIAEAVARALAAVHGAGMVHGLVGAQAVVPAAGRHTGRPVGTTLLLDTGVAALLGDRAGDLAAAAGVSLPADRGIAADVHALGALLLRMLTAAAPAGPALAALPVELRALLSAMLDEHPERRPSAGVVAGELAGLRDDLLATGPVPIQAPAPAPALQPIVPRPVAATAPRQDLEPRLVVPAPVPAPHTVESPIVVPRSRPEPAPSLWTGSVPVAATVRQPRRRGRRIVLLAGGVGLAGLLVGVVTHLPLGPVTGDQAVAAVADHGAQALPSRSATGSSGGITAATEPKRSHATGGTTSSVPAVTPAFIRPTSVVPSPLAASATSPTPSRTTSAAPVGTGSKSSAPVTSGSSSSSSAGTPSSDPATGTQASSPADPGADAPSDPGSASSTSADPATQDPAPSDSAASDPTASDPTASDPTAGDPTSTDPTDQPTADTSGDPSTP